MKDRTVMIQINSVQLVWFTRSFLSSFAKAFHSEISDEVIFFAFIYFVDAFLLCN